MGWGSMASELLLNLYERRVRVRQTVGNALGGKGKLIALTKHVGTLLQAYSWSDVCPCTLPCGQDLSTNESLWIHCVPMARQGQYQSCKDNCCL